MMSRLAFTALVVVCVGTPLVWERRLLAQGQANSIADRIKAQAALMEAQTRSVGEAAKTRMSNAAAKNTEIKNASDGLDLKTKRTQQYFSNKKMNHLAKWDQLEQKLENSRAAMVEDRAAKVLVYERTLSKDDLNEIRPGIWSGDLINRLFTHINSATGLTYGQSLSPSFANQLKPLSAETLKVLRFNRASRYGPIAVSLADTMPEILDLWPYAFFEPPLQPHVSMVTDAAKDLFQPGVSMQDKYELEKVFRSEMVALQREFLRVYARAKFKQMPTVQVRRILAAEDFLIEIERVVQTRAETNTTIAEEIPAYMTKYPPDQRNIGTLIQYTQRYGLELQPAIMGTEFHYDQLFEETRNFANLTDSAPTRESILDPIINLDLDAELKDVAIDDAVPTPAVRPTGAK